MEKDGSTHRDHPVAHTQRAVFVCRSALCDSRDVDSLKQNKDDYWFKTFLHICG